MPTDLRRTSAVSEHITWARGYVVFWLVVTLALFGGAYALSELGTMATEERALLFIMLATILIINAVWQATALGLARLETLILPRMRS
jgi:predicted metal-binding membrane protein